MQLISHLTYIIRTMVTPEEVNETWTNNSHIQEAIMNQFVSTQRHPLLFSISIRRPCLERRKMIFNAFQEGFPNDKVKRICEVNGYQPIFRISAVMLHHLTYCMYHCFRSVSYRDTELHRMKPIRSGF